MNIKQFNERLEQRVDESFGDIIKQAWSKVKSGVSKILIKQIANSFFKKHPELLAAVKAKFGQQQMTAESIELLEAKGMKGLMLVAITLALLSGIVSPASASERTTYTNNSSGKSQTLYITGLPDAFINAPVEIREKIIGSYIVKPDGSIFHIDSLEKAKKVLEGDQVVSDWIILSETEIEGTGRVSRSGRELGGGALRHLTNNNL